MEWWEVAEFSDFEDKTNVICWQISYEVWEMEKSKITPKFFGLSNWHNGVVILTWIKVQVTWEWTARDWSEEYSVRAQC